MLAKIAVYWRSCCSGGLCHQFHYPSFSTKVEKAEMFTIFLHSLGIVRAYSSRSIFLFVFLNAILLVPPSKEITLGNIYTLDMVWKPTISYFKGKATVLCRLLFKYTDGCSTLQESPMDECNRYIFWSVYGSFYVYFQGNSYLNAINDCVFPPFASIFLPVYYIA